MVGGARGIFTPNPGPRVMPGPQRAGTQPGELLLACCLESRKRDGAVENVRRVGHSPTSRQARAARQDTPVPRACPRTSRREDTDSGLVD